MNENIHADDMTAQEQDGGSMADFVARHRSAKLPSIQRQNQLLQRQRDALYGEDERQLRHSRGDYEE